MESNLAYGSRPSLRRSLETRHDRAVALRTDQGALGPPPRRDVRRCQHGRPDRRARRLSPDQFGQHRRGRSRPFRSTGVQLALGASLDAVRDAAAKASRCRRCKPSITPPWEASRPRPAARLNDGSVRSSVSAPRTRASIRAEISAPSRAPRRRPCRPANTATCTSASATPSSSIGQACRALMSASRVLSSAECGLPVPSGWRAEGLRAAGPPDNVLIVPASLWAELFAAEAELGRTACAGS